MHLLKKKRPEKILYGLVGYPLDHSFSKEYFNNKFLAQGIHAAYENFPLEDLSEFPKLLHENPTLRGLNVTIPYKQAIFQYIHLLDRTAKLVGAINTIKIQRSGSEIKLIGYNTDVIGFSKTLNSLINKKQPNTALILGSGGSAKAVKYVFREQGIFFRSVSSKKQKTDQLTYDMLDKHIMEHSNIIVNTTPLGMYPDIENAPQIPYQYLKPSHILIDLIYNPAETQFLKRGREQGATTMNGLMMLHAQAEAAWQIWKKG